MLAIAIGYAGYRHFHHHTYLSAIIGAIESATALALLVGASSQIAALIGLLMIGVQLSSREYRISPMSTLLILCVLCVCLVMTGAGAFAFDMAL
jgi:TRAP-type C4-dicarboxylate transport system permease large subunit